VVTDKDLASIGAWAAALEIGHECTPDRKGQRQYQWSAGLGPLHANDPGPPVEIIQAQVDHLTRAEPVDREQKQHPVIAAADRGSPIDGAEESTDFVDTDRGWKRG
jgi:hypothetical protein